MKHSEEEKIGFIKGWIAKHKLLSELVAAQDEYIKLLGDGLASSASYLDVHGWKYRQVDIDKGTELRAIIERLKEASQPPQPESKP